jgi:hypothetical protein
MLELFVCEILARMASFSIGCFLRDIHHVP